jgi:hypothetical protein
VPTVPVIWAPNSGLVSSPLRAIWLCRYQSASSTLTPRMTCICRSVAMAGLAGTSAKMRTG